jgi:hypothetical protein
MTSLGATAGGGGGVVVVIVVVVLLCCCVVGDTVVLSHVDVMVSGEGQLPSVGVV